jgi:peptidoglycan/LPS O-acetylase OafA/YrhL
MEKKSFYRSEIDGLRALAIIPVILFHANISGFGGGFVGVDIFFVISGYLITSIILREIKEGSFSLMKFWERRVRRIVPVMFFIASAVLAGAYFILLFPVDFVDFGQSLVAQSLFLANIFFMRKSSYFAGPSESMPLLHTWSLSVEEQFYIGFPILIFLIWLVGKKMYGKMLVSVLILLTALSFLYNVYLTELLPGGAFSVPYISHVWGAATNGNAAFFFLPARAWELLLGAIIATGILAIHKKWIAEIITGIGFVAIVCAVVLFNDATPFPGWAALIPTLGSALIILGNTHVSTATGKFLSFPVLVWIGLISFSLYLWHWPVIVFSKTLLDGEVQEYAFIIIPLIFMVSWFTFTFIETPFRKKSICPKPWQMFLFGFLAIVSLVTAGLMINHFKGFPQRASEASHAIALAAVDVNPREYECFRKNYREVFNEGEPCILGDQTNIEVIDFVLWGDSHSDSAMPVVDALAFENGQTGAYFGSGGCGPVIWKYDVTKDEKCKLIKEQAISFIKEHNVKKVLLIASWESDLGAILANSDSGIMGNDTHQDTQEDSDGETFSEALSETVRMISSDSNEIYIMKKVPVFNDYDVRKEFNRVARTNHPPEPIVQTLQEHYQANAEENTAIDTLASSGAVIVLDPVPIFCPNNICSIVIDGKIVYKNGGHLNTTGAMLLRPVLADFFTN